MPLFCSLFNISKIKKDDSKLYLSVISLSSFLFFLHKPFVAVFYYYSIRDAVNYSTWFKVKQNSLKMKLNSYYGSINVTREYMWSLGVMLYIHLFMWWVPSLFSVEIAPPSLFYIKNILKFTIVSLRGILNFVLFNK